MKTETKKHFLNDILFTLGRAQEDLKTLKEQDGEYYNYEAAFQKVCTAKHHLQSELDKTDMCIEESEVSENVNIEKEIQ